MRAQLVEAGAPSPTVIGIDEIAVRKGHEYRIVVSDLIRERAIWFDCSEASMGQCYQWLGQQKCARIRLAVMDMWKPFRNATNSYAPQAAILFDKFHVIRHLGEALDQLRKSEYARVAGKERRFKGQKYTLLSRKENLTLEGRQALRTLLRANKRLKDPVPDATTIWLFREALAQAGLIDKLFERFGQHLEAEGYIARGGQIIDATIVSVPKQRNTKEENETIKVGKTPQEWEQQPAKNAQKDKDARWTKKNDASFYGYRTTSAWTRHIS